MSPQRHTIFAQIKSDSSLIGSRIQTSTIWSSSPSHGRVTRIIRLVCAILHRIWNFRANIYFESIYAPLFRTVFLRTELLVSVSQRGRSARGIRFYSQRGTPQFLFNEPICISPRHIDVFNFLHLSPSIKRFEACRIPCWTFSNTPLRILIVQLSLGLLLEAKVLQDGFLGVLHSPTWRSWEGTHFGWRRFLGGRLIILTIYWRFIVAPLVLHLVALVDSDLRREG